MAYALPQPHPMGEKWLNNSLKTYRDLQQSISFVDTDIPGMRAIVSRFTAFVGCYAPLPPEYPLQQVVGKATAGRKRRIETIFLASVMEACRRYEEAVNALLSTDEIREAFMSGLLSPLVWCYYQKVVPVATPDSGCVWSVAELAPYSDALGDQPPVDWKIASVVGLDPGVAVNALLRYCCEPEYTHWIDPIQSAIMEHLEAITQ